MNVAERLVKILEDNDVCHIFGHPGEQILPFYNALKDSSIEHILMRHEQAAAHAADAYSRTSSKFGVCISTGGPGALNFTMALATAFKDNVPMLVITGDNPTDIRNKDYFQSIAISDIFKNITFKSFNPQNSSEAICSFKLAIEILNKEPKGPVHINLSKDILLNSDIPLDEVNYIPDYDYTNIPEAKELIKNSKKPLIIAGSGILYSNSLKSFEKFIRNNSIPIATTFHSKGIISEFDKLNLGLVGIRGLSISDYALDNADLIIAIGSKLSERTILDKESIKNKLIHINIDKNCLYGECQIHGDVKKCLNEFNQLQLEINNNWLNEIYANDVPVEIEGIHSEDIPLKPQSAIDTILSNFKESIIVNDAGSHTTWTTLLTKLDKSSRLVFSGSFAPMGYGLPGAIGAYIANPSKKIVLINGDGDFQMNIQELATVSQYNIPITICILNNNELGIIRQYQEELYNVKKYQVNLINPDFEAIAKSYEIESTKVSSKIELNNILRDISIKNKPFLIEINVASENAPLPNK
ncbi:thiamine pyrophosphate-binding protein [Methanobrevibacter sp. OttesenSCG-928-K11]|nr:thiamine pyrophosphate-binding protein [Methanobrevibacter sp. OttesenSCG-928-K11]MDL2270234.1 thiamine pyrophosphate-binding protein [Methanobrevibacter sp. OttesenSCG-928-I08]